MKKQETISDSCLSEGISRLKEITKTEKLKGWHFEKVFSESEIENFSFYSRSPKSYLTNEINPTVILGTTHVSYNNMTWIEMLGSLQRYWTQEPEKTIYNIHDETIIEKKSVAKYGDIYLISAGGNHRICLAKFLGLEKIKVEISEYEFDHESFRIYSQFQTLGFKTKYYISQDGTQWEVITNYLRLQIFGSSLAEKFIGYYQNQSMKPIDYLKNLLHNYRKFEHEPYHNIKSESQFEDIKMQIIATKHDLPLVTKYGYGKIKSR